jgi:dipeptidyl aminopeptidase/acylaminoacyl peptidase
VQLATVDRSGRRLESLPLQPGKLVQPQWSPDDRKLLFTRAAGGTADVWIYDFEAKEERQLTTDPDYDEAGAWSPDSRDVFYQGRRNGAIATLVTPIDRSRPEQVVTRSNADVGAYALDVDLARLDLEHAIRSVAELEDVAGHALESEVLADGADAEMGDPPPATASACGGRRK